MWCTVDAFAVQVAAVHSVVLEDLVVVGGVRNLLPCYLDFDFELALFLLQLFVFAAELPLQLFSLVGGLLASNDPPHQQFAHLGAQFFLFCELLSKQLFY